VTCAGNYRQLLDSKLGSLTPLLRQRVRRDAGDAVLGLVQIVEDTVQEAQRATRTAGSWRAHDRRDHLEQRAPPTSPGG
jgi:hypothetical protein